MTKGRMASKRERKVGAQSSNTHTQLVLYLDRRECSFQPLLLGQCVIRFQAHGQSRQDVRRHGQTPLRLLPVGFGVNVGSNDG